MAGQVAVFLLSPDTVFIRLSSPQVEGLELSALCLSIVLAVSHTEPLHKVDVLGLFPNERIVSSAGSTCHID